MKLTFNSEGYVVKRISPEVEELQKRNSKLEKLATVDGLTGLFNRRYFDEAIYQAVLSFDRRYLQKTIEKDKRIKLLYSCIIKLLFKFVPKFRDSLFVTNEKKTNHPRH